MPSPLCWDAVTALALPPIAAPVVAVDPDAELLAACAAATEIDRQSDALYEIGDHDAWPAHTDSRLRRGGAWGSDGVRFELTVRLHVRRFSRPLP